MTDNCALYRCHDADRALLYVGISGMPLRRLDQHLAGPWGDKVQRVFIEYFDSRQAAHEAELAAIASEAPRWNVGDGGARYRVVVYLNDDEARWLETVLRRAKARGRRPSTSAMMRAARRTTRRRGRVALFRPTVTPPTGRSAGEVHQLTAGEGLPAGLWPQNQLIGHHSSSSSSSGIGRIVERPGRGDS